MKNFRLNKKGFTLIELMIVIAIIGVLAAIAIPNFISYRNRSYCSATETTARNVAAAIAEYYSVPSRTATAPLTTELLFDQAALTRYTVTLSTNNSGGIIITAKDPNERCPQDYRDAANSGWSGYNYTFEMK